MPDHNSFTAAGVFPYKIFKNKDVVDSIGNGVVRPVHVQVSPTNRCNQSCSFCSYKDRDRKTEIELDVLCDAVSTFAGLGTKGITITGGGEPLMYPHIGALIDCAVRNGIKVGLVTNGLLLGELPGFYMSKLTWCRVSCSDEKDTDGIQEILSSAIDRAPGVDWALSYVVTRNYDRDKLSFLVGLANRLNLTHVRVVSDLLDLGYSESMDKVKESLSGMDDSKVIYQPRQCYSVGHNPCYISLLKPLLGADGYIYPCCGVQYAIDGEKYDFIDRMKMGTTEEIADIVRYQEFFDGSICDRCYYSGYNDAVGAMISPMKHLEFV